MTYDLSKLPLLVTRQEAARLLGLSDGRRLNPNRKPVAAMMIGGKIAPLFALNDTLYPTLCVNSPNRPKAEKAFHQAVTVSLQAHIGNVTAAFIRTEDIQLLIGRRRAS